MHVYLLPIAIFYNYVNFNSILILKNLLLNDALTQDSYNQLTKIFMEF